MKYVILGLSITSSWGNGHATTYRALVRELDARGHTVLFLERDKSWYAQNRDMPSPPYGKTRLYSSIEELKDLYRRDIKDADLVIVGSYVPDGVEIGKWVTEAARSSAFYDIDTPVTLQRLARGDCGYLSADLIPRYGMYLSFTGGPILRYLEEMYKSPMARPLYCSVDTQHYYPISTDVRYDLGYLGTYSIDRQPPLENLMLRAARVWPQGRFVVAGPQYPDEIRWPSNIERIEHLPPDDHLEFYNSQRFTLNITRADMIRAGFSPSVRLFEAAACGVPIISDYWPGLEEFFEPEKEILISGSFKDTLCYLKNITDKAMTQIACRAQQKILKGHTARHRAYELEQYTEELIGLRIKASI